MRLVDILPPFPASVPPFDLPSEARDHQLPLLPRCQTVFQVSPRSEAPQTCFLPSASEVEAVTVAVASVEVVDTAEAEAVLLP